MKEMMNPFAYGFSQSQLFFIRPHYNSKYICLIIYN